MRSCVSFTRRSRRGRILRVVREVYVRDDLPCGMDDDSSVGQLSPSPYNNQYLLLDTNVVLHQMDLLETDVPPLCNVIVPGTVLEEVRRRSGAAAKRLAALLASPGRRFVAFANQHHSETYSERQLGESPNDYNDRLIRLAAAWYNAKLVSLGSRICCTLLTNDRGNAAAARHAGVPAVSVREFVEPLATAGFPQLLERAAAVEAVEEEGPGRPGGRGGPAAAAPRRYQEHWGKERVAAALRAGEVSQGTLRIAADAWWRGTMMVPASAVAAATGQPLPAGDASARRDLVAVHVGGREDLNRATAGDAVAVQLYTEVDTRAAGAAALVLPETDAPCMDEEAMDALAHEGGDGKGSAAAGGAAGGAGGAPLRVRGRVVAILKRAWRTLAGSLELEGAEATADSSAFGVSSADALSAASVSGGASWAYFRPVDGRYPKVRLETRQAQALADKRILVAIDSWDAFSGWPRGHYVRTLGVIGDTDTETAVVLAEHDIPPNTFSTAVLACLPPASWRITPENSAGRTDMRHVDVCSIDPPGCKDIDDALHARELRGAHALAAVGGAPGVDPDAPAPAVPPGTALPPGVDTIWQLGVHIADVTNFVAAGNALDLEASHRGTTTYLVQRRLDMLPSLLTETLCSLNGGVDRFAFSVTWAMTPPPECRVLRVDFFKSIIHSRAALTYEQAQAKLDDAGDNSALAAVVRRLAATARVLRARRVAAGALTLASPEVRFQLDGAGDPADVAPYTSRETNKVVEEFMLLANCAVAERIAAAYPRYALLRRHPSPPASSFERLNAAAGSVDVHLDTASNKALGNSLEAAAAPPAVGTLPPGLQLSAAAAASAAHRGAAARGAFDQLLRILTTRCMMQAVYFPSGELQPPEYAHYGLATPIYTHFTSPIRRYADVVVHRLLAAACGIAPLPPALESKDALREVTDNLNKRHTNAQHAGRASVGLYTLLFFDRRVALESALVMRLRSGAFSVLVPRYGIEATVHITPDKHAPEGEALPPGGPAQHGFMVPSTAALALDEVAHTLTYSGAALSPVPLPTPEGAAPCAQQVDAGALRVKVFDCVTVALYVRHGAHHRRELVVKCVDPPFHALAPLLPPVAADTPRAVCGSEAHRVLAAAGVSPAAVQCVPELAEQLGGSLAAPVTMPLPKTPKQSKVPKGKSSAKAAKAAKAAGGKRARSSGRRA